MNSDRVGAAHTTVARRGATDRRHAGRRAEVAAFEAWQRSQGAGQRTIPGQRHGPLRGAPLSILSVLDDIKRLAEAAAPPCEQVTEMDSHRGRNEGRDGFPRLDEPERAERCR